MLENQKLYILFFAILREVMKICQSQESQVFISADLFAGISFCGREQFDSAF